MWQGAFVRVDERDRSSVASSREASSRERFPAQVSDASVARQGCTEEEMRVNAREHPYCDIFFNSEKIFNCVAADDEEGWVDVISEKDWNLGGYKTERKYGQVRIDEGDKAQSK